MTSGEPIDATGPIAEAAADQPAAQAALTSALVGSPSHAYGFFGPSGTGKRAAARAFAAELLAEGSDDPGRTRSRVMAEPSPHPDLAWLRPTGNQHLVDEVRERVISSISYRPFEADRRVFVIEAADAMAEESQNALLKTLEEPPPYAHLILISSEPSGLLETVRSRLATVRFQALPREVIERQLAEAIGGAPEQLASLAALSDGDFGRARFLGGGRGAKLRESCEAMARGARSGEGTDRPWKAILDLAAEIGKEQGAAVEAAAAARAEEVGKGRDADRIKREGAEAAKRADRKARTEAIDTAMALIACWFLDLVAHAEGRPDLARNLDRADQLAADAEGVDPAGARRAAESAMVVRRRLRVNVNEELALESLFHRSASSLGDAAPVR